MYSIVIADDEKLICDAILAVLNTAIPELASIQVFHNGKEAYDYVQNNGADILLLDIKMPGKSGLDIAQLISDQKLDSYVIIITAYRDFDYAKKAIDCNVDAFLTKPFSSKELIDTVQKGIASFEKKQTFMKDRQQAHRRLLQTLCANNTQPFYDEFLVCKDTIPFEELLCTEIIITDDGLNTLPSQSKSLLRKLLAESAETDTETQSSFLLECGDIVRILIFSKETPEQDFLPNAVRIIRCYTGNLPRSLTKTYPSFTEYRTYLSITREVDNFFQQVADGNIKSAKKQFAKYIHSLSVEGLHNLADYLTENFHTTLQNTDANAILQCMDTLASRSLSGQSNNYIVVSACEYIQQNYASSILSLETTADALCITNSHLSRLFKKHTNENFSEYLLKVRMEHARQLLETTNLPTTEIALAVGYENTASFRTSFKGYFLMTPRQYRQLTCGKEKGEKL